MGSRSLITRRAAIGRAAAAFAVPAVALGRGRAAAPSERINVACIGTGWMGSANVNSFAEEPDAQVVALCDLDPKHLEESAQIVAKKYGNRDCQLYSDYEEVLARPEVDAVVISVPDHWHGVMATAALRAGKDVYGEKPLAHDFAEGRAIRDACARYGRVWQTGSWQRSLPIFRQACEWVRNGRIGKVERVEVGLPGGLTDWDRTGHLTATAPVPAGFDFNRWLGPAPDAPYCPARVHKTWRWNLDYGGGPLLDWVGHHVDIAHWGLGFDNTWPLEVEGSGEFLREHPIWNAPGRFRVTVRYAGGVTMVIAAGHDDVALGTKWIGRDGWIWVERKGFDASPKDILKSRLGAGELELPRSPGHHRQFLDCVRLRRQTLTPAGVALCSATPGYLGLISILLGRKVLWDPRRETILDDPAAERLLSRPMRSPYRL